jgi:hypothetical protein
VCVCVCVSRVYLFLGHLPVYRDLFALVYDVFVAHEALSVGQDVLLEQVVQLLPSVLVPARYPASAHDTTHETTRHATTARHDTTRHDTVPVVDDLSELFVLLVVGVERTRQHAQHKHLHTKK